MHHLQRVKRDLAAQMEANKRLAGPSLQLSATEASSSVEGDVQQSASSSMRKLAASIEREVLKGMEAEASLQLLQAKDGPDLQRP